MLGAVAITVIVVRSSSSSVEVGAEEVFLEAATDRGANPFADDATGGYVANVKAKTSTGTTSGGAVSTTAGAGAAVTPIKSVPAQEPGLYGGTRDDGRCDAAKVADYLGKNPDKARAWAIALSIDVADIRAYITRLTPVILVVDTRVTNHGWTNGRANPYPAILQAGTVTLVDSYGVPRVKCSCGNPLTPPLPLRKPTYTGTRWSGFAPDQVIVVQQAPVIINVFVLQNTNGNGTFARPIGTTGVADADKPADVVTSSSTSSSSSPSTTQRPTTTESLPPITQEPTTSTTERATTTTDGVVALPPTAEEVRAEFVRRRQVCVDAGVVWPFEPNVSEDYFAEPTNDDWVWTVRAQGVTKNGKPQVWIWTFDPRLGPMEATNELARQANSVCPAFEDKTL